MRTRLQAYQQLPVPCADDQAIIEALADALLADYLAEHGLMVASPPGHDHTCKPRRATAERGDNVPHGTS